MDKDLTLEQIKMCSKRQPTSQDVSNILRDHDHIFSCETCYDRYFELLFGNRHSLQFDLENLAETPIPHLNIDAEELDAYFDGTMDPDDLEVINIHLNEENCARCQQVIKKWAQSRREFQESLSRHHGPKKRARHLSLVLRRKRTLE